MKKGLILEGGAMRGLFSAGIMDILREHEILFDGAIGVSAGAVFGCNYKSRQPGRVIRYNTAQCKNPRYCSYRSLLRTGDLFGKEFCYHTLPDTIDRFDHEAYRSNPMEFYSVSADLETGLAVYHRCDDVTGDKIDWLRASASMPLLSRIVEIDGYKLLDGGVADAIPLRYFESLGYDRNVLILTHPKDYVCREEPMLQRAIDRFYRRYPRFCDTMRNKHTVYNDTLDDIRQKERAGEIIVLRPDVPLPVRRIEHNADRMRATYEIGRRVGMESLETIQAFLKNR